MITGRINYPFSKKFEVGFSGAANWIGNEIDTTDNRGTIWAVAPDFGIYLSAGSGKTLDFEGGVVVGSISKDFTGGTDDENFILLNLEGGWKKTL